MISSITLPPTSLIRRWVNAARLRLVRLRATTVRRPPRAGYRVPYEIQESAASHAIERDPRIVQGSSERESVQKARIELGHAGTCSRFRFVVEEECAHRIDQELSFGGNHHSELRDFVFG